MITFEEDIARFEDVVGIDETSGFLEWLQIHPNGQLDLSLCTHLHAANLQVLIVKKPRILFLPNHQILRDWLNAALPQMLPNSLQI